HRQVLLAYGRHEIRLGADDVRLRRVQLRLLEPRLTERLSVQRPVEEEVVVRGPRRNALREARGQEVLLAGAGVGDAARCGHAGEPQTRPGVPYAPRRRRPVVYGLLVGGVMLPGERDGVGEREGCRDGLLAEGEGWADDEPDGQEQRLHELPHTRRARCWFRDATNVTSGRRVPARRREGRARTPSRRPPPREAEEETRGPARCGGPAAGRPTARA